MLPKIPTPTILITLMLLVNHAYAQNKAYYINNTGENLIKIDLDSSSITTSFYFGQYGVQKRIAPSSQFYFSNYPSQHLDFDNINKSVISANSQFKTNINSPLIEDDIHSLLRKAIPSPQKDTIVDSIHFNQKWHKLVILYSDDNYVGGRQNQVDIIISVESLGLIFGYSNPMNEHTNIMLCHQNNQKQKLLTQSYLFLEKNYPHCIPARNLKKIISLTQEYNFDNIIEKLTSKWLAPKHHLKLTHSHSEVINGHIKYSATIKNISNKRYCFYAQSYVGPAKMIITVNDKNLIESLEASNSSIQHRYLKKINNTIFLNPDEEISFSLIPNKYQSCGECSESPYIGFQIYRYGINFYSWIFHEGIPFNGNIYSIYNFKEIR